MENTRTCQGTKAKRHRTDRLIGFRLGSTDYETLTRLVSLNALSISAYLRQLVRSDAQRVIDRVEAKS